MRNLGLKRGDRVTSVSGGGQDSGYLEAVENCFSGEKRAFCGVTLRKECYLREERGQGRDTVSQASSMGH